MTLGLSLTTITLVHVVISLVGLLAGVVAFAGILSRQPLNVWNTIFLWTTILTSLTGYMFPSDTIKPSHIVGAISLVVLALAVFALYGRHLQGIWRIVYAASATFAFYLNAFVALVQAFQKVGPLATLAPTQSEPPFLVAQVLLLGAFVVVGFFATKRLVSV